MRQKIVQSDNYITFNENFVTIKVLVFRTLP